jgi:hypothetical protein
MQLAWQRFEASLRIAPKDRFVRDMGSHPVRFVGVSCNIRAIRGSIPALICLLLDHSLGLLRAGMGPLQGAREWGAWISSRSGGPNWT